MVTYFSSSGEEEYPKGEVVAAKAPVNEVLKITEKRAFVAAATTPAVGHPSSPEEGK